VTIRSSGGAVVQTSAASGKGRVRSATEAAMSGRGRCGWQRDRGGRGGRVATGREARPGPRDADPRPWVGTLRCGPGPSANTMPPIDWLRRSWRCAGTPRLPVLARS